MLMFPGTGPARFLPVQAGDAFQGAGGGALLQALRAHREQQRAAAGHMHPPTHPLSLPAAPGAGLLEALAAQAGGVLGPRS